MVTNLVQCTPVFLPGEPPSLTEKSGRPQSTGSQRVKHDLSDPMCINTRKKKIFILARGSSAPVRVEREAGAAAWLAGTLAAPSVPGHRLPSLQASWPYQSLSLTLLWLATRRILWPVFLVALPAQAFRRLPHLGLSLLSSTSGTYRGPPDRGPTL